MHTRGAQWQHCPALARLFDAIGHPLPKAVSHMSRKCWGLPLLPRGSNVTPLWQRLRLKGGRGAFLLSVIGERGLFVPCSMPPSIPSCSAGLQEPVRCLSFPLSLLSLKGWVHGAPSKMPLGRPVPVCLPRVLLLGRTRRTGAAIPITGCFVVSLCALNSGCISPLR